MGPSYAPAHQAGPEKKSQAKSFKELMHLRLWSNRGRTEYQEEKDWWRSVVEMISELPDPQNACEKAVKLYRPAISYI
jgi:hypothetical protein